MNKSILLASLLAAVALSACSKKEEPKVEVTNTTVVAPAPAASEAMMTAASGVEVAASAVEMAASAASK